jgi:hypothetical protein
MKRVVVRRLVTVLVIVLCVYPELAEPVLSALGKSWVEVRDEHPGKVKNTCEAVEDRYRLTKITEEDYKLLFGACAAASRGDWEAARKMLGISASPPSEVTGLSSLRPGRSVATPRVTVPLPEGSKVRKKAKNPGQFGDYIWVVSINAGKGELETFYSSELGKAGWKADTAVRGCWIKPRPGTSSDEIVCIRFGTDRVKALSATFELRVAP